MVLLFSYSNIIRTFSKNEPNLDTVHWNDDEVLMEEIAEYERIFKKNEKNTKILKVML